MRLDIRTEDVTIVVFTAARDDLIHQDVRGGRGTSPNVVVHMYTATAPTWRSVVLGKDRKALHRLIFDAAQEVARGAR